MIQGPIDDPIAPTESLQGDIHSSSKEKTIQQRHYYINADDVLLR